MVSFESVLSLAAFVFALGIAGALIRGGGVRIVASVQLLFGAGALVFVAAAREHGQATGQAIAILLALLAAAAAVAGAGVVLRRRVPSRAKSEPRPEDPAC